MDGQATRRDVAQGLGAIGVAGMSGLGTVAAQAQFQPAQTQSAQTRAPAPPLAPPDRQGANLRVPEPASRKVGWAVVGIGELTLGQIMPAFGATRLSRPVALVSGHADKARKVAGTYGIPSGAIYDYAGFDQIAENREVEAVYVVLPNHMHAEYTIRALRAGKHVLCEKPMAPTPADCERMIAAARETGRKLMIAYRLHYEPLNRKAVELARTGAYGRIKTISSSNCQNTEAPNIRLSRETAGGPLGDIGIYSINIIRALTGEEPAEVTAFAHQPPDEPRFREVPESFVYTLRFPSGIVASCDCSFGASVSRSYRVHCAEGVIDCDPAFDYKGLRLRVRTGSAERGDHQDAELNIEQVDQFAAEMDHFSDCILNGREPRTPGTEGLADIRVIEALEEAARTGRTVQVRR